MTWSTVMAYLCHKWHNLILSSFMTYHRVCGVGTAYPARAPEFATRFYLSLCCQITCLHVFSSMLWCKPQFPCKNDVLFIWTPIYFVGGSCFIYVICIFYIYWCPTGFPHQMMFTSFYSNTMGVTCGAGTGYPYLQVFSGVRVARS